jgi:hypothetical protein
MPQHAFQGNPAVLPNAKIAINNIAAQAIYTMALTVLSIKTHKID